MQAHHVVGKRHEENAQRDSNLAEAPRRIKALDQNVVNKIAAGEIIVAPVHALKELAENAVDAGSTSIEILIKDGGLKLLQISDNGNGIHHEDMPILCERFTTSKIKKFEDLSSIGSYGFRGEALASISHIARLRITTRTKESSCAWQAHYSDGKLVPPKPGQSAEPKACAGRQGTQITVEDLFYNVPTRRRAFRSASDEYAKILDLLGRYAVHCSGVAFTCKKHGDASMGITVQANASTFDRIRNIHGSAVANELIEFETASERWGFKSNGWISDANYHVKKLILLLFINNRAVESSEIKKAIEQTYSTFLPKGGHPFVYLSIHIDAQRVDVNVHPTKREVNFLNEEEIIEIICDEVRSRLGKVDTSRTFMTQSLLPGVKIPTISVDSPRRDSKLAENDSSPAVVGQKQPTQRLSSSASKPYENNLVRTDSKSRKITSMFLPDERPTKKARTDTFEDGADDEVNEAEEETAAADDGMEYQYTDREPVVCRLTSVKNLRTAVRDNMHSGLTEIIAKHIFVGVVDEARRIVAIQSGVKLYLVDYGMLTNEYFYQVGLTDFGNFGSLSLQPPLSLREVLAVAVEKEKEIAEDDEELDWDEVIRAVEEQLIERREMLQEYFSVEISSGGLLLGLPLLIKGYTPSMAKLPSFLLRLGPYVNWTNEEACFHSFLRELACWYVPETLPPKPQKQDDFTTQLRRTQDMDTDTDGADLPKHDDLHVSEDPQVTKRRTEIQRALDHVLFPNIKKRLIATKGMLKGVVEVADLKGLYRVFERC